MSINDWQMLSVGLFGKGKQEVLDISQKWSKKRPFWIATVNPEFVMKAAKDRDFDKILRQTDVNVVDGVGLWWAKEVLNSATKGENRCLEGLKSGAAVLRGRYDKQMVRGSELMVDLACQSKRVFLLGGFGQAGEKTGEYLKSKFLISNDKLTTCAGEPEYKDEEVMKQIQTFKPDLLLVAYGMGKQEVWIANHYDFLSKVGVKVVMGVGRSFDYYGGSLKRAPERWRKMGLEWLYSLIQEPKRWKRQLALVKFGWKVMVG